MGQAGFHAPDILRLRLSGCQQGERQDRQIIGQARGIGQVPPHLQRPVRPAGTQGPEPRRPGHPRGQERSRRQQADRERLDCLVRLDLVHHLQGTFHHQGGFIPDGLAEHPGALVPEPLHIRREQGPLRWRQAAPLVFGTAKRRRMAVV